MDAATVLQMLQRIDKRTYTMCEDLTCYFFSTLFIFFKLSCSFIASFGYTEVPTPTQLIKRKPESSFFFFQAL
jgi:hypothetical protein